MATILLVDDDPELRAACERAFRESRSPHELLTAGHGAQALPILESRRIDLLAVDLQMPVMDGFELASFALRLQPKISLLVLSELDDGLLDTTLEEAGVVDVLVKPIDADALADRVSALFARRVRGHLEGIGLSGFLQLLHLEGRSVSLTVTSGGERGTLHLRRGELVNARCGKRTGREAALEMLSWDDPSVELFGLADSGAQDVEETLEGLLMEAARRRDESSRGRPVSQLSEQWLPETPQSSERQLSADQRIAVQARLQRLLRRSGALAGAVIETIGGTVQAHAGTRLDPYAGRDAHQLDELLRRSEWEAPTPTPTVIEVRNAERSESYRLLGRLPFALHVVHRTGAWNERQLEAEISAAATSIERILSPAATDDFGDAASATRQEHPVSSLFVGEA